MTARTAIAIGSFHLTEKWDREYCRPPMNRQMNALSVGMTPPASVVRDSVGSYLLRDRALPARLAVFLVVFFAGRLALLVFLAAFLAAGFPFRAAFRAAEACFFRAGAFFTAAMGAAGAGMAGAGIDGVLGAGMAGFAIPAAGALIASSQPGVNISSRSREIALARPQRGHRAS
jgi:hypothetical protein